MLEGASEHYPYMGILALGLLLYEQLSYEWKGFIYSYT